VNAFFQALQSRVGKIEIPSDVRALFQSIDADEKLREAFDEIDVTFDIDERTHANHQDLILLFANRHDESFAALDNDGSLIRLSSDLSRAKCESMATLVGDILVDVIDHADLADKEEPAYVVMAGMEHANLPLSYKVKKAFKSLTR
jgi:hypothetical protein